MSLDEPVIPWSDELAYCIAANKAIGEVEKYQESYVCYASTGYMCEASGLSVIRTHGSAQPITARLDIVTAPAEYCLPIKKDRRFAPEFTVQVTLGTSTAANLPAKVLACPFSETHRRSLSGPLRQRLPQFLVNEALGRSQPASTEDRQKWYLSFKGQTTTHLDFDSNRDTVPHTGGNQVVMQKRGTFTGLEYLKSSHMERVYLLFVMTIGDSPDIIATLFSVPTIVICRASQRRLATERLGYPLSVYDDLRSRGCSYNLPSRKPGAMPPSPATPGRAAAAAAAAAVAAASAGVLEGCGGGGGGGIASAGTPVGLAVSAAVPLGSITAAGIALLAGGGDRRISGNGGGLSPMALPMRSDGAGRGTIFDLAPQPPEALAAHNSRAVSAPPAARGCGSRSGSDEERTQDDREHDGGAARGSLSGHKRGSASGEAAAALAMASGNPHSGLMWMQGPPPLPPSGLRPAEDLTAKVARMGNSTPTAAKPEGTPERSSGDMQSAALLKTLPEKLLQGLVQFYEDQQKGRPVSPQTQMDAMAALQKLQAAEAAAAAATPTAPTLQHMTQLRPWRLAPKVEPLPEAPAVAQPLQRAALPMQPAAPMAVRSAAPRGQQTSPVSDASAISAFAQKRLSSSRAQGPGARRSLPDIIVSNANFELPVSSEVLMANIHNVEVLAQVAAAASAAAAPSAPRGPSAVRLPNSFAERAVRCALDFFYSGRAALDPECVLPTLAVASHFESPALVTFCLDFSVELVTGLLSRWLPSHGATAAASAPPVQVPALPAAHGHVSGAGPLGLLRVDPGTHPTSVTEAQLRGTPMSRTPPSGGGHRVDAFDAVLERYEPHMAGKSTGVPDGAGMRGKMPSAQGLVDGQGMSRVELLLRTYEAARRVSTGGDASGRSTGTAVLPGGVGSPRKALEHSFVTAHTARRSSGTGDMPSALGDVAHGTPAAAQAAPDGRVSGMHALAEAASAIAANMHGARATSTPPSYGAPMLASGLTRTSANGGADVEAAAAVGVPAAVQMPPPSEEQTRQALDLLARIVGTQPGRALQANTAASKALADGGAALEAARRLMQGDGGVAATAAPAPPASTAADGAVR